MRHLLLLALLFSASASAAEFSTCADVARSRLIQVQRSGTINNGVNTTCQIDKADTYTPARPSYLPRRSR